jgi:hypothetical protein
LRILPGILKAKSSIQVLYSRRAFPQLLPTINPSGLSRGVASLVVVYEQNRSTNRGKSANRASSGLGTVLSLR